MFGHRYFGQRYFAPRYFGDGGTAAGTAPDDYSWIPIFLRRMAERRHPGR